MSNATIRAAIEGRLKTWAAAQTPPIPIAFENVSYAPETGKRYLRGLLMPADTQNPSQGGKHKHYHGIYQVSVYVPTGGGPGDTEAITGPIEALFACPTTIVKNGLNVNINQTPAISRGLPDGAGFHMTPITIKYDVNSFS